MFKLFLSGFLQVACVALNTVLLARGVYAGVLVVSFLISFLWSFNVKRVAFGTMADRLVYSGGAAVGGVSGLLIAQGIAKIF